MMSHSSSDDGAREPIMVIENSSALDAHVLGDTWHLFVKMAGCNRSEVELLRIGQRPRSAQLSEMVEWFEIQGEFVLERGIQLSPYEVQYSYEFCLPRGFDEATTMITECDDGLVHVTARKYARQNQHKRRRVLEEDDASGTDTESTEDMAINLD